MRVDGGAQQFPGAPPAVHSQHPQDLQEAQAAQGCGQHVALVTHRHHRHRGDQHEDVWERTALIIWDYLRCSWRSPGFTQDAQRFAGELQPPPPSFVAAAASGRPDPQSELCAEDEDGEGFLRGTIKTGRSAETGNWTETSSGWEQ